MNRRLTTGEKLKDLRAEKHLKLEELSKAVHISVSTLSNYENDENYDISAVNILELAKYYDVSTDYLLGRTENRTGSRTEIEEPNLDDETLEILKSGGINNRLLCEMMQDPDFVKFMIDIEIYVDGIAQSMIDNMNAYLNVMRNEIAEKYQPSETELYFAALEAAKIDEGNYFTDRIHLELDKIIRRIKTQHINDDSSMQSIDLAHQLKEGLREAEEFQGTDDEKKTAALLSRFGINYHSLTQEEFQTQITIFKKSKFYKKYFSNRGKRRKK